MPDYESVFSRLSDDFLNGFAIFDPLAQFLERDVLELADAFPRHAELLADFLKSLLAPAIQAESVAQNRRFARIQRFHHLPNQVGIRLVLELLVRRIGLLVFDQVAEAVGIVVADWRIERSRTNRSGTQPGHAKCCGAELFSQFFVSRLAAELFLELHRRPTHME